MGDLASERVIVSSVTFDNSHVKPTCYDGSIYWPHIAGGEVRMMKTDDPDDTDFAEVDAANAPSVTTGSDHLYMRAQITRGGRVLFIYGTNDETANPTNVARFDMNTDLWLGSGEIEVEAEPTRTVLLRPPAILECRASDGNNSEWIAAYQSNRSKVMGTDYARVSVNESSTFGGTWGTSLEVNVTDEEFDHVLFDLIDTNILGRGCVVWARAPTAVEDARMFLRGVRTDALGLETERIDVDGSSAHEWSSPDGIGNGATSMERSGSTIKCRMLYVGDTVGTLYVLEFDFANDPSTFTQSTVGTSIIDAGDRCFDMAAYDDVLYAMYTDDGGSVNMTYEDDSGSDTWTGSPTVATASTAAWITCNVYARKGKAVLGYVRSTGGTADVIYDEIDLPVATALAVLSGAAMPVMGGLLGPFEI